MRSGSSKNDAPDDPISARICEPELDPPFDVIEPACLSSGVVLSSPHSGRIYPERFLQSARLDAASLRRSEDAFVDDLFLGAVRLGCPLLRARFPRAFLDVNREPYELDPRMFDGRLPAYANTRSLRVAGGLGTIARIVGDAHEIYARRLPVDDALQRIEALHRPYHAALLRLTNRAVENFGLALLIDCHSMPSSPAVNCTPSSGWRDDRSKADVVLGDRYGTSCDRAFADAAEYELKRCGFTVERNKPYAGGYITEHYGHPGQGRHALQIEINRALYMDERTLEPTRFFGRVSQHLEEVVGALAALADRGGSADREAAE